MVDKQKIRILIADDHPLFRSGVKQELRQNKTIEIVAEAENGEDALRLIESLKPDIAILDIRMPVKSGLQVLSYIKEKESIPTKFILLTMHHNKNYLFKAISLGVKGYLLKDDAIAEILEGVGAIINGEHYVSSSLSGILKIEKKSFRKSRSEIQSISSLTHMERQVLKLVAEWKTNNEIADELFISPRTAGNHRTNISRKLDLTGTYGIIKFALENKDLF